MNDVTPLPKLQQACTAAARGSSMCKVCAAQPTKALIKDGFDRCAQHINWHKLHTHHDIRCASCTHQVPDGHLLRVPNQNSVKVVKPKLATKV